jgi:hypothetical protein
MAYEWIATAATAALGVAGLAATVWTTNRQQQAEARRLEVQNSLDLQKYWLSERRRLYGAFLATGELYEEHCERVRSIIRSRAAAKESEAKESEAKADSGTGDDQWQSTWRSLRALRSEISVLTGDRLGRIAGLYVDTLDDYAGDRVEIDAVRRVASGLRLAMRYDLQTDVSVDQKAAKIGELLGVLLAERGFDE